MQLVVIDALGQPSDAAVVTIDTGNTVPVAAARAWPDDTCYVGEEITLDGSESYDLDGHSLSYLWAIVERPPNSLAGLDDPNSQTPRLIPDLDGFWTVKLVVDDGYALSTPAFVRVLVMTPCGYVEWLLLQAIAILENLQGEHVDAPGHTTAMKAFLKHAIRDLQEACAECAIQSIEKVMRRTDGCTLRYGPDGEGWDYDWVQDCSVQIPLYDLLTDAVEALTP